MRMSLWGWERLQCPVHLYKLFLGATSYVVTFFKINSYQARAASLHLDHNFWLFWMLIELLQNLSYSNKNNRHHYFPNTSKVLRKRYHSLKSFLDWQTNGLIQLPLNGMEIFYLAKARSQAPSPGIGGKKLPVLGQVIVGRTRQT